jgi:RNA polymerase sigma-70 factor (ECF subfamily)
MPPDRQARFETLVSDVGEPLRRYARRRVDRDTADDVVADAFLVIWRRLDDVPAGYELAWCYSVARLCLSNAQRAQRRHVGLVRRLSVVESTSEAPSWESDGSDPAPRPTAR